MQCALLVSIRQQYGEFFTAVTGSAIRRPPDRIGNQLGSLGKTEITKGVAILIIELLEMWPRICLTRRTRRHHISKNLGYTND